MRTRQWTGAHAGIFLVATFALCAVVMYVTPEDSGGMSLVRYAVLCAVVVAACLLAYPDTLSRPSRSGVMSAIRLAWFPLVLGLAFGCVVAWAAFASRLDGGAVEEAAMLPTSMPLPHAGLPTFVLAAVICLLVGVFEELLFRGILFETLRRQLKDRGNGLIVAALVSSALFGLAHLTGISGLEAHPVQELARFVQACVFGLVMCAVYLRAGSIWPAVLAHALYDLLVLWPSAFVLGYPSAYLLPENPAGTVLIVACAALILASLPATLRTLRNRM